MTMIKQLPIIILILVVFAGCALIPGCLQQPEPPDQDVHGCRRSVNQTWCSIENRCVVLGVDPCPTSPVTSFKDCIATGYPVMESYPRQCRGPGGQIFVEDILEQRCKDEGGHWNECSSRCRLDNANRTDIACPAVCDALCECGGIAGFRCPAGYTCRSPAGIADALGYCVQGKSLTREQALALAQNSSCAVDGNLTGKGDYNAYTRTWWLEFIPSTPNPLCNPACVVDEATGTADINWRCTGLIPPGEDISGGLCTGPNGASMTFGNALQKAQTGECGRLGTLTDRHFCNENTGTWWIDLEPLSPKPTCNPACVIDVVTGGVEVNWRCTGLIPP